MKKNNKRMIGLIILSLLLRITGCSSQKKEVPSTSLITYSQTIVECIKDKKIKELSQYVHPTKGVRFTPYAYIDLKEDLVFSPKEMADAWDNSKKYTWGAYDGSGFPIELTLQEYYEQFIYDVDFANPQMIGNNKSIGTGNTENNIQEAYPNGVFMEYHFSGINPEYAGMDWRSLRLVFEKEEGIYYLVGIVHDQWTI